ncbi:hypothetical protein ACTWPT_40925 [Nonomuraea sp. 3N208]|uniref:hypothetical protein n=1 Tax=Nonomuraea sp. 3N208 TaxID=3457421 RepID=UPI003FD5E1DF
MPDTAEMQIAAAMRCAIWRMPPATPAASAGACWSTEAWRGEMTSPAAALWHMEQTASSTGVPPPLAHLDPDPVDHSSATQARTQK